MTTEYRPDFTCGKISKVNGKILQQADQLIRFYQQQNREITTITLQPKSFDSLQRNLQAKTEGRESLTTHNYKQFQLVKGPV